MWAQPAQAAGVKRAGVRTRPQSELTRLPQKGRTLELVSVNRMPRISINRRISLISAPRSCTTTPLVRSTTRQTDSTNAPAPIPPCTTSLIRSRRRRRMCMTRSICRDSRKACERPSRGHPRRRCSAAVRCTPSARITWITSAGSDHSRATTRAGGCAETLFFDCRRQGWLAIKGWGSNTYERRMHPNGGREVPSVIAHAFCAARI